MSVHWGFADKAAAVVSVVATGLLLAWMAFPSASFIKVLSTSVSGSTVRFVRELPYGAVTAQWQSEITLLNGKECSSGDWGIAYYQPVDGNRVSYEIGDWARSCIDAGPPFYLTTVRRVLLFGVIPLRRSVSVTNIEGEGPAAIVVVPVE